MWGGILSEAKDLRGPSALRPQGDRKEEPFAALRATEKERAQGAPSLFS